MGRTGIVAALLLIAPRAVIAQTPHPVSGTYALWICAKACTPADTSSSVVSGFLVLDDFGLDVSSIPAKSLYWISGESRGMIRGQLINACFSLARRHPDEEITMLAGGTAHPYGLTTWVRNGDSIALRLYGSPDAFYTLSARLRQNILTGWGWESGYVGGPFSESGGIVYGRRIGQPDIEKCFSRKVIAAIESDTSYRRLADIDILKALELRDEGLRRKDAKLAASGYGDWAEITDEFGARHEGPDSVMKYLERIAANASNKPRRRDLPRVWLRSSDQSASVDEYFETLEPVAPGDKRTTVRRRHRLSVVTKTNGDWKIVREITMLVRDRPAAGSPAR